MPTAQVTPEAVSAAANLDAGIGVTAVGQKAAQFSEDFEKLQANTEGRSAQLDTIRALLGLDDKINRQQQYVTNERNPLVALAADINAGQSYGSLVRRSTLAGGVASAAAPGRGPLLVIRFETADVAYEPTLYHALSRALEKHPDAVFDVVAVAPMGGSPGIAKQRADAVLESMTSMGLPSGRVSRSTSTSATASSPEVHVFVH